MPSCKICNQEFLPGLKPKIGNQERFYCKSCKYDSLYINEILRKEWLYINDGEIVINNFYTDNNFSIIHFGNKSIRLDYIIDFSDPNFMDKIKTYAMFV